MRLVTIPSSDVDLNPDSYNSNFHTLLDAPDLPVPDETPQAFSRWLPLIASSQNISSSTIQIITLTPPQTQLILDASSSSLHTREANRLYVEELADLSTSSTFTSLVFPPEGLFLRLDECSPKDGVKGTSPLRSPEEAILRLATSHRATNAMIRGERKFDGKTKLIFLTFDAKMDTAKEFRVFCAPPNGRITAVSQYKWHKPSVFREREPQARSSLMKTVMDGIQGVHKQILGEAIRGSGAAMDKLLLEQGFTFDVVFDQETEKSKLIELNSFGARSGCGSCLFHWLSDFSVLYGSSMDGIREVEFRISV
ncbi:hypothetical protein VTL71DRAFT_13165 [Oculimacula yallundae]|uniref:Cell division cycle protein 123 n=1 Tax=Oculimacula yallundae TaxID=86028 RepID=A0ABR4CPP2_9HELO